MSPRENLLRLLRRQGYEHNPVEFALCPSLVDTYRARTGGDLSYGDYFAFAHREVDAPTIPGREGTDWLRYYPDGVKDGTTIHPLWGIAFEPGSEAAKHMTHMRHPLALIDSLEELQAYPFPDFSQADTSRLAPQVQAIQARGLAAYALLSCTIWETSWYMRSMEALMMDMATDDEKAVFLLDTVTEASCQRIVAYAQAGVDFVQLGDDIGMQSRIMMSEEFYREWLKPRLARVIAAGKAINPDLIIAYHSCGYVLPLIPDLIEVGVDVLNPVQPECMDFSEVHAAFGDRLSFWGTIGTQTTMPFGTPDEVKAMVHRNLEIAGPQGGLWCAPTHVLEPEVPWENILAYVEACREYTTAGVG